VDSLSSQVSSSARSTRSSAETAKAELASSSSPGRKGADRARPVSPELASLSSSGRKGADRARPVSPETAGESEASGSEGFRRRSGPSSAAAAPVAERQLPRRAARELSGPVEVDPHAPAGNSAVGHRVRVWWPLEKRFFSGKVVEFAVSLNEHRVSYDDGDVEWIRIDRERIEWLTTADNTRNR
jgi:sister-chromatid-cohesion protein PDS5